MSTSSQHHHHSPLSFENLLIEKKFLTRDQLMALRCEQQFTKDSQIILIAKCQLIASDALKELLVTTYQGEPFRATQIRVQDTNLLHDAGQLNYFKDQLCVPFLLEKEASILHVACVDILNLKIQDYLKQLFGAQHLRIFTATPAEIFALLNYLKPNSCQLEQYLLEAAHHNESYYQTLTQFIIEDALSMDASDIHFDVNAMFLTLRYRIDGLLVCRLTLHAQFWLRLVNCLKVKAHLNMTETRLPQSGRFSLDHHSITVDCRLSTHPTHYGECAVIRLLNHSHGLIALDELGFDSQQIDSLMMQCRKPDGLIIFTGPTGSGKTTSLYAIIRTLMAENKSYITLEDPIEYNIDHLRQSQINPAIGFDYQAGIKSMLRLDPDVILIGEIRDEATARMAMRAAMTGHLVLTTLHVNSVFQVGQRFQDLGINLTQMSGLVRCLISQRLVRKTCAQCAGDTRCQPCLHCQDTGYKGRKVIAEVLSFNEQIDQAFIKYDPYQLQQQAIKQGFQSLRDNAHILIQQKMTTSQEITRILGS